MHMLFWLERKTKTPIIYVSILQTIYPAVGKYTARMQNSRLKKLTQDCQEPDLM
jgi:hypothetical protein